MGYLFFTLFFEFCFYPRYLSSIKLEETLVHLWASYPHCWLIPQVCRKFLVLGTSWSKRFLLRKSLCTPISCRIPLYSFQRIHWQTNSLPFHVSFVFSLEAFNFLFFFKFCILSALTMVCYEAFICWSCYLAQLSYINSANPWV